MVRKATKKSKQAKASKQKWKKITLHKGHRDIDLVKESVAKDKPIDRIEDMPHGGQFTCAHCDLYFIDQHTVDVHMKTKAHKRRMREWKEKCHTVMDAEMAAGLY
ncbi:bud site selection protein 20 [Enteropsectra breve]|nr:bud site selection protein 20 [Enteropsectra breve]